jgi:hypothetical protein
MNIQQFQYILAVAEHKHFEIAAEKCCITQSTLSTMISKFEDEIGFKIFDRKKKPVQLTNEGKIILEQLTIIVNNIDQLKELTNEVKGEVTGSLTLSVIPTIAPFLLPLFLQDFATKFPNLKIKIREETTSEIVRKLKSRELDIGILSVPLNDKEIIEIKLYDEPFLFFDAENEMNEHITFKNIKRTNYICQYLLDQLNYNPPTINDTRGIAVILMPLVGEEEIGAETATLHDFVNFPIGYNFNGWIINETQKDAAFSSIIASVIRLFGA